MRISVECELESASSLRRMRKILAVEKAKLLGNALLIASSTLLLNLDVVSEDSLSWDWKDAS